MPTELAVGYVSLVASTDKLVTQVNAALGTVGRDADKHGARIGQRMSSGIVNSVKSGVAGIGATLGLSVGAAAFGQMIKLGNDFTTAMNTMRAVSSATAAEMEQVSARARQLGNDVSLPGTSASDAAAAMLELAKGGFTVGQSMDAARGSLQLAAAAQIGAAEAATIQVGALQSFGLAASDAGRVSDVLANAANASSAEITDVAYALQAGGAVAHGFGLTIEDTAAAIGLMANSGIKGSDAGTLLKSALLALTDTGKPAQAAIAELGLSVYDAQGRFVGLHSLFEQLDAAAGRMTDQQYQAATSVLFGSDAMRLSSIAAEKGAAGFDQMHDAMSRQGSAADVAAAKMQGLPGAMQSVQNAAEGLGLGIYDVVKGPLEQLASGTAGFITDQTPRLVSGLEAGADALGDVGSAIAPVVKEVLGLPTPVLAAAAALAVLRGTGLGAGLTSAATTASGALSNVAAQTRAVVTASERMVQINGVGTASLGRFGSAVQQVGTNLPVVARMQTSFLDAAAGATTLARTQGTLAAATTGLRSAASGVVGALGGPYALALTGGITALTANIDASHSAQQAQRALADATAAGARAQADFATAVAAANGGLSTQALGAGTAAVKASLAEITTLGDRGHKPMEELGHQIDNLTGNVFGSNDAWERNFDKVTANVERYNALRDVMGDLKIDMDGVGQTVTQGGPAYDTLISKLRASGDAGRAVADTLTEVHDRLQTTAQAAQSATPGVFNLAASIKILADRSSSAADRVDAMKTALDVLAGKPIAVQDALAKYNEQVRDTAHATQEAWDKSQGFGSVLVGQGGQVDTATENGKRLYDTLGQIRDATITAAVAGADMGPVLAGNERQFEQLAAASGLTADQVRVMGEQLGLLPKNVEFYAKLQGADTVQQELALVAGMLQATGEGAEIPVQLLSADTLEKLRSIGAEVEEVNGKPGVVRVSLTGGDEVMRKLDELIAKKLPDKNQRVMVQYLTGTLPDAPQLGGVQDLFPRADGGIDNLPRQGTIWSPRTRYYQVSEPETGGEAFIPLAPSKRSRSLGILSTVADMFGYGLTKMAEGGITGKVPRGIANALAAARSVTGNVYAWGGTGPTAFDCSGFVGWLQQIAMGIVGSTERLYTTHSLLGGQTAGLKPGLGPAGTWFRVGANQQHMAATIAGQPVEAGGSHNTSRIGAPAVGATDGQFSAHFYLPNALIDGIGAVGRKSKTAEWTESDDIDLEQAQLSVEEARAQRDKVYGDAKSSELDKRRADLAVREAETRLREKQTQKDEAAADAGVDGYTPEAPPLEKRLSDDEIAWEQAQLSVDEAKSRRDDVYADPEATQLDQRRADLQLQSALNDRDKAQRERDKKSFAGQTASLLQKAGTELLNVAAGALSEMTPFGLGELIKIKVNNPWEYDPTDHAPVRLAKFTGSQEEIDQQLPVTLPPGADPRALLQPYIKQAPQSIQDWIQGNAKVFDQGGWLEPGDLAVNLSRRPEPLFNSPQQLRQFLDVIPAPASTGSGNTEQWNITNNGMDPKSSAAAVERIRRRRLLADQRKGGFGR